MVQSHGASRFTVLLPPEPEGWQQMLTQLLEPQGVQTLTARSGRDALEILESRPVHAMVLDTQMPQLGGMQVLKLVRDRVARWPRPPEAPEGQPPVRLPPPAILLASHLTSSLLREALGMHVFSVLSKPVEINLLLDALARLLRRYHENRWPGEG